MKKYMILAFMAAMVLTFSSCETEVDDPAGLRNEGIVPAITNLKPAFFDVNEPATTFVKFDLDATTGVSEINIVASYNKDLTRIPIMNIATFPAKDIKIYMRDVATALGIELDSINPGDMFTLEALTTQGANIYRSNAVILAAAACAYDPARVSGSYKAVSGIWEVDGPVTITVDPDNKYIVYVAGLAALDGLVEDKGPLKMVVDSLNFGVIAERTVLASVAFSGYTNIAYEGFGDLNTCDGTYEMNFTITVDQGSFGQFPFTLTKLED